MIMIEMEAMMCLRLLLRITSDLIPEWEHRPNSISPAAIPCGIKMYPECLPFLLTHFFKNYSAFKKKEKMADASQTEYFVRFFYSSTYPFFAVTTVSVYDTSMYLSSVEGGNRPNIFSSSFICG